MKSIVQVITILVILSACNSKTSNESLPPESFPEAELGWELGSGSYGFKYFTFFEALDKIDSCGLKYVEGFPNHTIGEGIEETLDYRMALDTRLIVLEKLKEKGIKMNAYGVISPDNEEDWHKLFEFGKAMGIETFSSEPDEKFMPLVSKLCDEYKINLAIHNHAEPSTYWNPEKVLATIDGYSDRIGACADVGHWLRSGLDPIASLKKLEGRLLHLHMKDLNEKSNKEAHDVHWGTGVVNVDGVIAELKRQGFEGSISAEYEYNWYNSVPDITASIEYFRNSIIKQGKN